MIKTNKLYFQFLCPNKASIKAPDLRMKVFQPVLSTFFTHQIMNKGSDSSNWNFFWLHFIQVGATEWMAWHRPFYLLNPNTNHHQRWSNTWSKPKVEAMIFPSFLFYSSYRAIKMVLLVIKNAVALLAVPWPMHIQQQIYGYKIWEKHLKLEKLKASMFPNTQNLDASRSTLPPILLLRKNQYSNSPTMTAQSIKLPSCSNSQAIPLSHSLAFQGLDQEHGPILAAHQKQRFRLEEENVTFSSINWFPRKERWKGTITWEPIPILLETPKRTVKYLPKNKLIAYYHHSFQVSRMELNSSCH